jgi:hypothetical protein
LASNVVLLEGCVDTDAMRGPGPRRRCPAASAPALGTLAAVSVTQQGVTCPGPLEEERPGAGTCARGDACEVLELQPDYLAYRTAHLRVISLWRDPRPSDPSD